MANPKSLKDKAGSKCLICRQAGHWSKECPNCDRSPKMACFKCHQLGHWVTFCPGDTRASGLSMKPSLMMVQKDWSGSLQPAHLSQITITELEPRSHQDVAGRSKNFLVDRGATYSVLTSNSGPPTLEPSPPALVSFWVLQEKQLQKDSPEHFFIAGMDSFPPIAGGPWVSYSLIGKRSFPAFEILQLLQSW